MALVSTNYNNELSKVTTNNQNSKLFKIIMEEKNSNDDNLVDPSPLLSILNLKFGGDIL